LPQYKHLDVEVESPADEIEDMEAALAATHGETSLPPPSTVVHEPEQRGGTETGVL
jgi:DNA-directed RNA polymerase subunit beta'